jgi:transposase
MRTVRRQAEDLNQGKLTKIAEIARLYAIEKQHWLTELEKTETRSLIKSQRKVRDAAIAQDYKSVAGLQARMWKLALIDACETMDKYWQALFVDVKEKIHILGNREKNGFTEPMLHYAYWLLSGYKQFFACMDGLSPAPKFEIDAALLSKVAGFVHRQVKNIRGNLPSVNLMRSFALDADCYEVFRKDARQYIAIMTDEPRKRLVLPLRGHAAIQGNIRIVIDGDQVAVHVSQTVSIGEKTLPEVICAVDVGYTEVMMDNEGNAYGTNFGAIMTKASDERNDLGKSRNKLRALATKYGSSNSPKLQARAKHIKRFNLGGKKWDKREAKVKASIEQEVNTAINTLVKEQKPTVLVTEKLSNVFKFDSPKRVNRRLSNWSRGVIEKRFEFKALAECFRHKQVNPAYSSKACPLCDFVDDRNRVVDKFLCLHCGHTGHADRIAAINLINRLTDPEITLHTQVAQVKAILLKRFNRRVEASEGKSSDVTVPGRTSDTAMRVTQRKPRLRSQQGGRRSRKPGGQSKSEIKQNVPAPSKRI